MKASAVVHVARVGGLVDLIASVRNASCINVVGGCVDTRRFGSGAAHEDGDVCVWGIVDASRDLFTEKPQMLRERNGMVRHARSAMHDADTPEHAHGIP